MLIIMVIFMQYTQQFLNFHDIMLIPKNVALNNLQVS